MNTTVSIITAVYNVEPYIRQCIESLIHQTMENIEIILIDDGSPDHCGEICDDYSKRDSRIRVIHKENQGLSAAWNDGLRIATGEWIAFVDSDDWIDENYFEKMLAFRATEDADIIISNGNYQENDNGTIKARAFEEPFDFRNGEGRLYLQLKTITHDKNSKKLERFVNVWGKLYRTSFIQQFQLKFDIKIRAGMPNDLLFNYDAFDKAKVVLGIIYSGYHYRILASAGTRKYDPYRPEATYYVIGQLLERIKDREGEPVLREAVDEFALTMISINFKRCYFHPENKANYFEKARKIREMKRMDYYHNAIHIKNNRFLTRRQEILQFLLKLPFVWPLYLACYVKK